MKEIVLITLALDLQTGEVDWTAPFKVNSGRVGTAYNRLYNYEARIIEQLRPGEWQAQFEAEWNVTTDNWIFGKRIADA